MWQKCLRLIRMTMSADKFHSHDLSLKQAKYSASKYARYCILLDQRHNVHIILARPVRGEKFNRSGLLPFLKSSAWPSRELILGRIMAAGEPRGDFIRLGTRTTSRNGGFKVPYFRVSLPLFFPSRVSWFLILLVRGVSRSRHRARIVSRCRTFDCHIRVLQAPTCSRARASCRDDDQARFNRAAARSFEATQK